MSMNEFQVVTANRLVDGAVLYLDRNHLWCCDIDQALLLSNSEQVKKRMDIAAISVANQTVLDPYVIKVTEEASGSVIKPVNARERIRALGPSIIFHIFGDRDVQIQ